MQLFNCGAGTQLEDFVMESLNSAAASETSTLQKTRKRR
jgi:hypothetical protein